MHTPIPMWTEVVTLYLTAYSVDSTLSAVVYADMKHHNFGLHWTLIASIRFIETEVIWKKGEQFVSSPYKCGDLCWTKIIKKRDKLLYCMKCETSGELRKGKTNLSDRLWGSLNQSLCRAHPHGMELQRQSLPTHIPSCAQRSILCSCLHRIYIINNNDNIRQTPRR